MMEIRSEYHDWEEKPPILLVDEEEWYELCKSDYLFGNSNSPHHYPCLMTYVFKYNKNGEDRYETRFIYPDQAFKLFFEESYQKSLK